jgi:hypothetical protein
MGSHQNLRRSAGPGAGFQFLLGTISAGWQGIYDFTVKTIDGKSESLSAYKGKTVLIVNVASKCGFTPQYSGLQSLFAKYKDEGLSSLVFLPTTLQVKNLVRMLKLEPSVPGSTTPPFRCSRKCL